MHINNLKYLPDSCPEYVSGEFNCSRNDLLSLNNSPEGARKKRSTKDTDNFLVT
jgi:hypothetical protein